MSENILTDHYLDLRGYVCPVNFVKCCLALENIPLIDVLRVDLDVGESEISVIDGLQDKGYKIKVSHKDFKKVTLIIASESK